MYCLQVCETAKSIQNYLNKREELVSLTAETGGQNFMIVDSSALTEQVVDDVIESALILLDSDVQLKNISHTKRSI